MFGHTITKHYRERSCSTLSRKTVQWSDTKQASSVFVLVVWERELWRVVQLSWRFAHIQRVIRSWALVASGRTVGRASVRVNSSSILLFVVLVCCAFLARGVWSCAVYREREREGLCVLSKNRTQKSACTAQKKGWESSGALLLCCAVVVVVLLCCCSSFRINSDGIGIIIIVDCAFLLRLKGSERGECSGNPAGSKFSVNCVLKQKEIGNELNHRRVIGLWEGSESNGSGDVWSWTSNTCPFMNI